MNIKPNNDGWRFDESVGWKLIHNDIDVIFFEETDKAISTQEKLFVGTKEECEAEMERLDVLWDAEEAEANYKLVYNDENNIIYFGPNDDNSYDGTEFLGSKTDCEIKITMLGLTWPSDELVEEQIAL